MSRIGPGAFRRLDGLLKQLREINGLAETRPAIFYLKRIPMLHFHETENGLVADLKRLPPADGFDRLPVETASAQQKLLAHTIERCRQRQTKGST
jgi:hypothetical protein